MENNNLEQNENSYAQWVTFDLYPSNFDLSIRGAKLDGGKFYHPINDKDNEMEIEEVNKLIIQPKDHFAFGSSGSKGAPKGTTGSFQLWDNERNVHIGNFAWDCPFWSNTNSCSFYLSSHEYIVEYTGANINGGALGSIVFRTVRLS